MREPTEEKRFRDYLEDEGLKFTQERKLILQEVFRIHDHFEADDIVIGLRDRGERVSRASVYRTLPLLVGSGLLRPVHSDEKHGHYEHVYGHQHHDHLVCSQCGRVTEFVHQGIEHLQDEICAEYGFVPTDHRLEIFGTCEECKSTGVRLTRQ